jgi:hypothetical protein
LQAKPCVGDAYNASFFRIEVCDLSQGEVIATDGAAMVAAFQVLINCLEGPHRSDIQ